MLFSETIDRIIRGEVSELIILDLNPSETEINLAMSELKVVSASHENYAQALFLLGHLSCKREQYPLARDYFQEAMELGNSMAMVGRAEMHRIGQGGPANYSEAIILYEKAIRLGNSWAMVGRAEMHRSNQGVPSNFADAIRLYEEAIRLGNSMAMVGRAEMHRSNQGVPSNFADAIRLYEEAIRLDNSWAMIGRAQMHQHAYGGRINYPEAIRLYKKAIGLGNAQGVINCAVLCEDLGGLANCAEASHLYFQGFCLFFDHCTYPAGKDFFQRLKRLAIKNGITMAKYYLTFAYLKNNEKQEAQALYLDNVQTLPPFFLKKTLTLIDKLPKQKTLVDQHLELVQLNDIPPTLLPLWHYVQFRLKAKTAGYPTAYLLTSLYPDLLPQLNAMECYELAHVALNDGADDSIPENKILCLTQACHFFYLDYQKDKDNKTKYVLLQKLLCNKEALENGDKSQYVFEETSSSAQEEARLQRFVERVINKPRYSQEIQRIADYLEVHHEDLTSSDYHLLTWLSRRLSYNISFTDSLSQPHIKQQISESSMLNNNPILKSKITNDACKKLLKATHNRGQLIYEALPKYDLDTSNLEILA